MNASNEECREHLQGENNDCAAPAQEPLEYWNAVEGWVSIPNEDEPTPAAWVYPSFWDDLQRVNCGTAYRNSTVDRLPLYTAPPQRKWVGLTDKEHEQIAIDCGCASADWVFYGAAVERKLKEKNNG